MIKETNKPLEYNPTQADLTHAIRKADLKYAELTEKLKGTNLDEGAIMNAETQRLIHKMSLDIIDVMFDNLPNILDSISADMRLKADKNYKCSLQSNDYKNKECK